MEVSPQRLSTEAQPFTFSVSNVRDVADIGEVTKKDASDKKMPHK